MDIDPSTLFTPDTYEIIETMLGVDDDDMKFDGLQILSSVFALGNPDIIGDFPIDSITEHLVTILSSSQNETLVEIAALCVHNFLESHYSSTRALINHGALPAFKNILQGINGINAISNIATGCYIISQYRPDELITPIGINALLTNIDKFNNPDRRSTVKCVLNMVQTEVTNNDINALNKLIQLAKSNDLPTAQPALAAAAKIIDNKIDSLPTTNNYINEIINICKTVQDGTLALSGFKAMMNLTRKKENSQEVVDSDFNFNEAFDRDFRANNTEVKRLLLNVVVNCLPDVGLPNEFWRLNGYSLNNSDKFARSIQGLIQKLILNRAGWEHLLLSALASIINSVPEFEITGELISALGGLSQTNGFMPFVLLVLSNIKDSTIIIKTGALGFLNTYQPKDEIIGEWYKKELEILKSRIGDDCNNSKFSSIEFNSLDDIIKFLNEKPISPNEFKRIGLLDKTSVVLKHCENSIKFSEESAKSIEKIRDLLLDIIVFSEFPYTTDPIGKIHPNDIPGKIIQVDVIHGEHNYQWSFQLTSELYNADILAILNEEESNVDTLMQEFYKCPASEVTQVVKNGDTINATQASFIARACGIEKRKAIMINEKGPFRMTGGMLTSIARSLDDADDLFARRPVLTILDDPDAEPKIPEVPKSFPPSTLLALECALSLHKIAPSLQMIRPTFDDRIRAKLASPFLTSGLLSSEARLVYHYPFLFSLSTRKVFYKIAGLDLTAALPYIVQTLFKEKWTGHSTEMRLKVCIRRDHILEDGERAIDAGGSGPIRWDLTFNGEEGIGSGPAQEFFSLYAKELTRGEPSSMWRKGEKDSGDSVNGDFGLFPNSSADPKLFYRLGKAMAKAGLMGMVIPLPFSIAFMKALLNKKVGINEVDRQLSRLFSEPEKLIGVDFECFGDSGEATAENVHEKIKKAIENVTNIRKQVDAFIAGYNTAADFDIIQRIFEPEELLRIFSGDPPRFSKEQFLGAVVTSGAYNSRSDPVLFLANTVAGLDERHSELFVKFVTGAPRLPIGGLSALSPPLTVVERETDNADKTLPSVSTCVNYLKLPHYTSEEALRNCLLIAIEHGQDSFSFT